ncbi:DMT family transporter [Alphaproteobacteria bacterium LSUCC0744]
MANVLMCCAALFWGATFIAQKTGMETIGPMGFTFGRYVIGTLVLMPLAIWEARKVSLMSAMVKDRRLCWGAFGLGLFMFGGIGLQQTALIYTNVANAAFLTALYVPLVPLIAAVFLRRYVAMNIWPAVVISLVGSFLLSGKSSLSAQFGDLLIVGGAFFWAGHILLIQSVMTKINAPFQLSVLQSIVTVLIAGLVMLPLEAPAPGDFLPMLPQLAFAGIVAVGLGFTIQLVAQRHTTASAAALILSLESVFAAFFGWWLLGETLVLLAVFGCILIFLAVVLAEVVSERQIKTIFRNFRKPR